VQCTNLLVSVDISYVRNEKLEKETGLNQTKKVLIEYNYEYLI
jgi:hypothetical protein